MVRVVAQLVILFALVYAGVSIWYDRLEETLRQAPVLAEKESDQAPAEKTEIVRRPDDYTVIVKRNIFQAAITKTEPKETTPEVVEKELAPTKLKLSLMGTISGTERDARAIISDDVKRQQDIYQVGDSIQGAMIKEIERGKVVLNVNNSDEILTLKEREGGGPAYQPSPSDFYKEPEVPQAEEVEEVEGAVQTPGGRQPRVRPRPIRRPLPSQQNQPVVPNQGGVEN